jgi:hypothetical protein
MIDRSRKMLTTVLLLFVLAVVLFRLGYFESWGDSPPVRYILSPPQFIDPQETAARYWLHVPAGTEEAVTEELITGYLVPSIMKGAEGLRSDGTKVGSSVFEFLVFSTPIPGTEEIKRPRIDDPDSAYLWSEVEGLQRR